jgi:hypothetical protein
MRRLRQCWSPFLGTFAHGEVRKPQTNVLWAQGYPIAGDDDDGHEEALALAAQADLVLLTLSRPRQAGMAQKEPSGRATWRV